MGLTKCPHCGHTVLTVASRCPGCGQAIGAMAFGPTHRGDTVPCRSCGRKVKRRSATCTNCGATNPGKRTILGRGTVMALGLVAAVVAGIVLWGRNPGRRSGSLLSSAGRPAPTKPAAREIARGEPERRHDTVLSTKDSTSLSAPPAPPPTPATTATPKPPLAIRWTALWANVRSEPRESAAVVRVLKPGTRVEGIRNPKGWWQIFVDGDSIGYVAGVLLANQPPDSGAQIAAPQP